ncbi:tRNA (adenosine(37)-N6)-threonylcarbamoyltransferase complex transferase subunit TsaD [Candidatus Parcubacteria bacterium]|nr:tRNA (adenosine(37)-N6)-threonylcarbamoyltransferase complex transferase subunit TsaD [Candidatus Parcubacteria bacterium]
MRLLGIESSCDETALALVVKEGERFEMEKSVLSSQAAMHARYGGVVPEVAAREHAEQVFPLLVELGVPCDGSGIDVVAVTAGPGLIPALRIGVELGKSLAWAWGKPLVAVNHLEGHIYSVWISAPAVLREAKGPLKSFDVRSEGRIPLFPSLCLIVSGGHTELVLMRGHGQYELLGRTRDDAAGEAFDKVAKLLGLGYPGGPEIARLAQEGDAEAIALPRPMLESGDLDFSFSGLKTAVKREQAEREQRADLAAGFQQAVVDVLVSKTMKAVEQYHPRSVILTGGVSANRLLRETLAHALNARDARITFHAPDLSLTGDNAVMIAAAGAMRFEAGQICDPLTLSADANWALVR